jgi:protein-disulfide isomerase-like protein with CxxC motif
MNYVPYLYERIIPLLINNHSGINGVIQNQHQVPISQNEDEMLKGQEAFAQANGVSQEDYVKAYNSFTVNSNLQRAEELTQRYHVEGVPLMVVDGKYTTDVAKAGSQSNLIQLISDLAAAEHKH